MPAPPGSVISDVSAGERHHVVRDAGPRLYTIACWLLRGRTARYALGDFKKTPRPGQRSVPLQEMADGKRKSYEIELCYLGKSPAIGSVCLMASLVRGVEGEPQFVIEEYTSRC
jgi:hypothetical protein